MKIKLLEIGTSIDVKCKKVIESKLATIENQENSSKASNKPKK